MIDVCSLDTLLQEKETLEKKILQNSFVSLKLFSSWRSSNQAIGQQLADQAFQYIAKKNDAYIVANPVNPSSYAHFLRLDVQSKPFATRARTSKSGIRSGFIESDATEFSNNPLVFSIMGQPFYAVIRNGEECLVRDLYSSDVSLNVSTNQKGLFITSDIDLISIFLKNPMGEVQFDEEFGELTSQELDIICEVNQSFQKLVSNHCNYPHPSSFKLIAHGPANQFSNSKTSHIHYPLNIHNPNGTTEILDDAHHPDSFLNFHLRLKTLGYFANLNQNWKS